MIKYLFCDNISDKHSDDSREHWVESAFLSAEAPENWKDDLEKAEKELSEAGKRKDWQDYLPDITKIALFIAIMLAIAAVYELVVKGSTFAEVFRNHSWYFWGCGAALIAWAALFLLGRTLTDEKRAERKNRAALKQLDDTEQKLIDYLGVPKNAVSTDILRFTYEEKDGKADIMFIAENLDALLFSRDGALCVFDGRDVFAFPKNEMTGIKVIEKELPVGNWNKSEPQESDRFRKYGVRPQFGLRYFCSLETVRGGEKYCLPFPAYELDTLTALTGLSAPKLPSGSPNSKKKGKR